MVGGCRRNEEQHRSVIQLSRSGNPSVPQSYANGGDADSWVTSHMNAYGGYGRAANKNPRKPLQWFLHASRRGTELSIRSAIFLHSSNGRHCLLGNRVLRMQHCTPVEPYTGQTLQPFASRHDKSSLHMSLGLRTTILWHSLIALG